MDVGIGLDARLGLSLPDLRTLAAEAAGLGYTSAWTPAGATARDAFHICAQFWEGSHSLTTGTSVVPVPAWTVPSLASQAATLSELTGGQFILGIGPGAIMDAEARQTFGTPAYPAVGMMRDYVVTLRGLLRGQRLDYDGPSVSLRGARMAFETPPVPVYLAAMGPRMLRLAGESADGAMPNWSTPEQLAWCRERIAEGARSAGRDPADVTLAQYVRVCIDEDEAAARRALAGQVLGYALARRGAPKTLGYRAHFARMGFDDVLNELEARRDAGAATAQLIDAVPEELLRRVGYFGGPARAPAAFAALARGLDTAIVRLITAHPGLDAVRLAMRTLAPAATP